MLGAEARRGRAHQRPDRAQQLQRRVVDATRRVLQALLADRPLVLVLDALQWADPSSIDLLIELMGLTDEAPILFVYVFTPEPDAPSWQLKEQAARSFPHRYAELALGPLRERAARELMCSLLSCAETPPPGRGSGARADRRQPVLHRGGAAGADRERRAAPRRRALGRGRRHPRDRDPEHPPGDGHGPDRPTAGTASAGPSRSRR